MKLINESVKNFTDASKEYMNLMAKNTVSEDSFRHMDEDDFKLAQASYNLVDMYSKMLSDLAYVLDEQTIKLEEIRTILKEAKEESK